MSYYYAKVGGQAVEAPSYMNALHTSDLDQFVKTCDAAGGIGKAKSDPSIASLSLKHDTVVDTTLDPFGEEYFIQQAKLHHEITGQTLKQNITELYPIDVALHIAGTNPYADSNIPLIARHAAIIMCTMALSGIKPGAKVLDLGCGWGLTSELIAYCGGNVHAVDINPLFVELISKRVERHGLPITATVGDFDAIPSSANYDLIFFYECLHHALRPWETLRKASKHLAPGGKIMWAGEPVNEIWWPAWGLRLDVESLYVMRKFGWFESGWSLQFISACFNRAGMDLLMHDGPLGGGLIGEATLREP